MTRPRTVAIIGPDFPPCSRPSALRVRSFAAHLEEHGWRPIVLTTEARHQEGTLDPAVETTLPASLEVIRTRAIPARLARRVGIGDVGMRSLWHHWHALAELCRQREVDLVFISVPPSVPMVLGRLAWERFGVPYVIDYQDPWRTEFYWSLPPAQRPPKWRLAYWMARVLEPPAVRRAAHVVAVSSETGRSVLANYPGLGALPCTEIPFGVEPADFDHLRAHPRPNLLFNRHDGNAHFIYTGAFIEPMSESLRALLEAVRSGLAQRPRLFSRLRLHFVGTSYASAAAPARVEQMAAEMGLAAQVTEQTARVPYFDALQLLLDAHALLLLGSREPHYSPSKTFALLQAAQPVLAVVHAASNVVPVLRGSRQVEVITFSQETPVLAQVEAIGAAIERMLTNPRPCTAERVTAPWTSSAMAARLAAVFDQVVASGVAA